MKFGHDIEHPATSWFEPKKIYSSGIGIYSAELDRPFFDRHSGVGHATRSNFQ